MPADCLLHQYKCQTRIKIINFIEDKEVVEKILKHLGLWFKKQPSPKANAPPKSVEPHLDYSDSQPPPFYDYLYVDEPYPENLSA